MGDFWNRSPSDSDSDDNPIYVAKDPRKDKHFDRKQELLWNCKRKAGKVGQGKEPLVIAVIGPPGCGKSSFLNTIFATFSHDCWTEHAKIGEFGRRDKQVTRRLTSYHTDNGEYLLPTFLDMTGFEDENTPLNKELLRIVFCGKLGEKEELNEVRKFGELYGVNAVKEKYFGENYFGIYKKDSRSSNPIWKFLDFSVILNREEYLRVNRIIVVCSANPDQPLPESLFEAVSDITNRERDITLYGVLTQSDKYKSRDQKVLKREREFMRALGIPKNRFARIKNYCPDIDPNMTYEDTIIPSLDVPVLRLMRQVLTAEPTDQDYTHRRTKNGKYVPNLSKSPVPSQQTNSGPTLANGRPVGRPLVLASQHWPNVGKLSVRWSQVYVGCTTLAQRWQIVGPLVASLCWLHNIGPTLANCRYIGRTLVSAAQHLPNVGLLL